MDKETADQIVMLVTVIPIVGSMFMLIPVAYFNILLISRLRIMVSIMLLLSIIYSVLLCVQNLYFRDSDTYIWSNWIVSFLGLYTLMLFVFAKMELLFLFSPIAPFWDQRKVRILQAIDIGLHFVLNLPCYLYPLIASGNQSWQRMLHNWYYAGIAGHAAAVSVFCSWEICYLVLKLYQHWKTRKHSQIALRQAAMIQFVALYAVLVFIDWMGLYLYVLPSQRLMRTIALSILGYRPIILVVVFNQLRSLTFTKDELFKIKRAAPSAEKGNSQRKDSLLQHLKLSRFRPSSGSYIAE
jgi:hypothetical protein